MRITCVDRKFIKINEPMLGERERQAAVQVIESGVLTSPAREGGPAVQRLERLICEFTGARYAISVSSGTAALQAALISLGVKRGDEVLVPSFSYVATANAVYSVGAAPVFVDVRDNYTMNPACVRSAITGNTAAIIPVHLYGHVADIPAIRQEAPDIPIIEDAAQSLGSTINGRHTGTLSEMGCYSMYPGKVATAGEGGVVVTGNEKLRDNLLAIRNHGNTGNEFNMFGINLRMPEISAAIGAIQIDRLPYFLDVRRRNASLLSELLRETGLVLPNPGDGQAPNWGLYTISLNNRDSMHERLYRCDIGAAIYYKTPIHLMPLYRSSLTLPETERAAQTVLSLPVHPGVTPDDISYIARVMQDQ